jgi:hypothetical protein
MKFYSFVVIYLTNGENLANNYKFGGAVQVMIAKIGVTRK